MFVAGEQVKIDGEVFEFVSNNVEATPGQIQLGSTPSQQAENIQKAIIENSTLNGKYKVDVVDNKITLTQNDPNGTAPTIERIGNTQGTVHFDAPSSGVYTIEVTNIFRENEVLKLGGLHFTGALGHLQRILENLV